MRSCSSACDETSITASVHPASSARAKIWFNSRASGVVCGDRMMSSPTRYSTVPRRADLRRSERSIALTRNVVVVLPLVPVIPTMLSCAFVKVSTETGQRAASTRDLRPGDTSTGRHRVADNSNRTRSYSGIDVAVAIGCTAAHRDKTPPRLHTSAVIVESEDVRIALLREDFASIKQLEELHSARIIAVRGVARARCPEPHHVSMSADSLADRLAMSGKTRIMRCNKTTSSLPGGSSRGQPPSWFCSPGG